MRLEQERTDARLNVRKVVAQSHKDDWQIFVVECECRYPFATARRGSANKPSNQGSGLIDEKEKPPF
jgi:hypothetical protein